MAERLKNKKKGEVESICVYLAFLVEYKDVDKAIQQIEKIAAGFPQAVINAAGVGYAAGYLKLIIEIDLGNKDSVAAEQTRNMSNISENQLPLFDHDALPEVELASERATAGIHFISAVLPKLVLLRPTLTTAPSQKQRDMLATIQGEKLTQFNTSKKRRGKK